MDYDLNKSQKMLEKSAKDFLSKECTSEYVRKMAEDGKGFDRGVWDKMAELGWMGINIPVNYDGIGLEFLDLAILLKQMGYHAFTGPFFSTVVLGALTLLEAGSEEQKMRMLPQIVNGKKILTLAWMEESSSYSLNNISMTATSNNGGYVLSGSKRFVPDAQVADIVICFARDENNGISAFIVDTETSGVQINSLICFSGEKLGEIVFDNASIPAENILGVPGKGDILLDKILSLAAVGKSAEMCGGARAVMSLAVPYSKERKQFGRPIGAFQAIQHHLADMLTSVDTIEFITLKAAWLISKDFEFRKEASMCKAWASDSYKKLVKLGHQVIGGISFMEEYDLQLYFKRAKTAEVLFGDGNYHRERVAEAIFS